ncbi:hypothetical protein ACFPYJ_08895 [Paenibacillus solisilvae]|uniref:Uncharacterized protein n=1 Tax=Paenibacillus solisilvae TaxID=2486751 RepID=A0ABW0VTN9_9BACL
MFDPTVFDNLKVAIENQIYDLDNLTGQILVTNRIDRMELSVMSRFFALQFTLTERKEVTAEIRLEASLKDLAAEILEQSSEPPACTLSLRFHKQIDDVAKQCKEIEEIIQKIWQPEVSLKQTLSFSYGQNPVVYENTIEVGFNRKISEEQMGDIPELIDHMLLTLNELA